MKRIALLTLLVSLLATASFAAIEGSWTSSMDEKRPDRIYLNITRGKFNQNGSTTSLSSLAGLTAEQVRSTTVVPVHFEMRREAGTVAFDGTFRNGFGAGQFAFTPDRSYIKAIQALGIEFTMSRHRKDRDTDDDLFTLAIHDVSTAYIRSMIAEGYRVTLDKYLSMRIFDVSPEFICEMRSLGYRNISDDDLVACRIHGVSPAYIREMRAAGWDLSLDDLQASRIHGATPEFAAEMKRLGYSVSHDQLVAFRIHGVTPKFIAELHELGYDDIDADDLIAMRIHGVTPEFIRELAAAGYTKVPPEKLVAMRIHGIDARFVRKLSQ